MDKGMPQLWAEQMQCLWKCLLDSDRRKKSKEPSANHIHSISFAYEADRDPARALDKWRKTSGCGSMGMERLKDRLKQAS